MEQQIKRRKRTKNFTTLDLTALRDDSLSWQAKGLHSYLMQLPDDWKIYVKDLQNRATNGRDSVSNILNELISKGYLERNRVTEKGRFIGYDYIIYEHPSIFTENGKTENGKTENGKTENGKHVTNNRLIEDNIKSSNELKVNDDDDDDIFYKKHQSFVEKLDNDKFTFTYIIENVNVSENQLKEIWPRLTKAFVNQLINDKKRHDDFESFSYHFRNYSFKRIPNIIKQNSKANESRSSNKFKSKEQARDEYKAEKFRDTVNNLDWIVSKI